MSLALHIGAARLALGIKAVKLLLQPFLRRFTGIDCAALALHDVHHFDRPLGDKPKKRGPDQRVPVITSAIALSEP
jgi:hypothetical protein